MDTTNYPALFGWILFGVCTYMAPAIIAAFRGKRNQAAILVLNFFAGWTFIGWVVALVWSCMAEPEK